LKFGEMVIATASLVLVGLILDAILVVAFIPLGTNSTSEGLAYVISFLVVSFVVGYVFSSNIQETPRVRAVGGIAVLSAFAMLFFLSIWFTNPVTNPWFKDSLNNLFNTSGWTNYEWDAFSALAISMEVVIVFVFSFIGLYAGSMLRKPSAKTKE